MAAASAMIRRATVESSRKLCSSASKVNHSLTKPPNGGIAARLRTASPNATAVRGSLRGEAAERAQVACAGGSGDAVGGEEGERLRDPVHDQVQGGCEQAGGGEFWLVGGLAEQGDAEAEQDDAAVLDARVAEEAGDLVLGDGVEDADERAEGAEDEHEFAPPGRAGSERLEDEPPESVEAGVVGDRDGSGGRGGRGGVERRQSGLAGDEADLGAEADEQEDEGDAAGGAESAGAGPGVEVEAAGLAVEQREGGEQAGAAELGEAAAEVRGEKRAGAFAVGGGEQVERERDRLPGEQEDERLVDADHGRDREQDQRVQAGRERAGRSLEQRERHGGAGHADQREEDPGEPVRAEVRLAEAEPAAEVDAGGRPVGGGGEADGGKQRRAGGCDDEAEPDVEARQQHGGGEQQHGGDVDAVHAAASRVRTPVASSSPCRSAIGLGGEPGTYTSTGRTVSTPPAVDSVVAARPPLQASVPAATTAFGSGIVSQARRSGARIGSVTPPLTSRMSAWRGERVKKKPSRCMS